MPRDTESTASQPSTLDKLPAPTIAAARDGSLSYDDTERDLEDIVAITADPRVEMKPGNLIEFFWGKHRVGSKSVLPGDTGAVTIRVSKYRIKKLGDGDQAVTYTITTPRPHKKIDSLPTKIRVKKDTPLLRNEELPFPSIAAARDGGLGYEDIERDPEGMVTITVGPYPRIASGDLFEVFFGDPQKPENRVGFKNAESGDTGIVNIYVGNATISKFSDGVHAVSYTIFTSIGQETIYSLATNVEIKRSVPGGPDPRPDTPYLNENLAPPGVTPYPVPADAQFAKVTVPAWLNMAVGDVLTVIWAGHRIPPLTVADGQVGQSLVVTVDRATLEAAGGGRIPVTYEIRDRVFNWSLLAPYTDVDVEIEDPNAPDAPQVVDNGTPLSQIDLATLGTRDATVWVPRYAGIQPGHSVVVEWRGLTASGQSVEYISPPLQVPNPVPFVLVFTIPNNQVTPLGQGSVRVAYLANGRLSRRTQLAVIGEPLALSAPQVPDAVAGVLDPANVPNGARFIVPFWPGIKIGDRVDIFWDGLTSTGQPHRYTAFLMVTNTTTPLNFTIALSDITAIAGGSAEAHYTVTTTTGTVLPSPKLPLQIRAVPTQPLPAPTVDGVRNGVIDASLSSTNVQIPHFASMALNDLIRMIWNAPLPTFAEVTVSTLGPQTLPVAGTFIAGNLNASVSVSFSVTSSTGQDKGTSPSLTFRVEAAAIIPGLLRIPKAPAGRLNVHNDFYRDEYLIIEIPQFPGMASGQSIVVEWAGPYFTWSSQPQQVTTPGLLQFQVPRLEVIDAIGRSVQVRYSVNGTILSPTFVLNIDSQGIEMPPPRFFYQNGATDAVSILSPGQQTGHTGRVRWSGVVTRDSSDQHLEAGRAEYFQIPKHWSDENKGREVLINHTIHRQGIDDPETPLRFSRVLRLRF
ncbi:hypothetical protein GPJ81_18705 [Pseudomonas alkylphenolica]|uniref:Uncharacterized protein n=1 Tax=Pseudomonas alkylphenolica TaxID=237609 RepID=A0A6I6HBV9_9PSED|nr:hypothetical protein [Pseudomonas alkylphenolica]QGW78628.1 hypothetical protein GPJ81_18705 [Pseudomonas alkylphenolica]